MNETVTIKEGGLTRRLAPIDKLKVNTTDNKESTWVSAGKANTGVLHASENGIYIASEVGYEAYSDVFVRVTKDSYEGDTSFDDWDYETPDMDLSNWDPETIEEFENDPEAFDEVFNNEDEWKDIDKPIDIKMDNPKIQDTKISGIDPVTGNEMEVGLDEDGYLTETTLPSSIKIITPPNKLQYIEGQKIDLRGIVVQAYTEDGNVWQNENYPDGIIPANELTASPDVAILDSESARAWGTDEDIYVDGELIAHNLYCEERHNSGQDYDDDNYYGAVGTVTGRKGTGGWYLYVGNPSFRVAYIGEYGFIIAKTSPLGGRGESSDGNSGISSYWKYGDGSIYTYNNKTVYSHRANYYYSYENSSFIQKSDIVEVDQDKIAWAMFYGGLSSRGNGTITVSWTRSDGEVLTDTFGIEVLPDPDGAHPQVDPSTVEWNHRRYKANEDLGAVEVRHGSVYMEDGAIYDVGAAVRLGMLEPVDNEIVP